MLADIAVFPLSTVLFPEGVLPLRIFEARYVDMVRDCMRSEAPFGVCLIVRGNEVGEAAEHETIGCLARIRDWGMEQAGVLELRTVGGERFRVLDRRVATNGLIHASVELLPDDPQLEVPDEFADCSRLLSRIVGELEEREADADRRMIAAPYRLESASWVSNRLCEFLPIPVSAKHKLMALDDPLTRLSLVRQYLTRHKVL